MTVGAIFVSTPRSHNLKPTTMAAPTTGLLSGVFTFVSREFESFVTTATGGPSNSQVRPHHIDEKYGLNTRVFHNRLLRLGRRVYASVLRGLGDVLIPRSIQILAGQTVPKEEPTFTRWTKTHLLHALSVIRSLADALKQPQMWRKMSKKVRALGECLSGAELLPD
jgi:hypothetical protein